MNTGDDDRQLQAERLMIEEVKKRPFLWNEKLAEHKNLEKTKLAWDTIGRMFAVSGTKAKSRWKSMRDIYGRYLRKMARKEGRGNKPKWKHFEAMSFLQDHIKHRRDDLHVYSFRSSTSGNANGSNEAEKGAAYDGLQESDEDEDVDNGTTSKRVTRQRKRKRLAEQEETNTPKVSAAGGLGFSASTVVAGQQQLTSIGGTLVPVTTISCMPSSGPGLSANRTGTGSQELTFTTLPIEEDADDLFGRSIAAMLKKMPTRTKSLCKLRIHQVLYEVEEMENSTAPPPNAIVYQSTVPSGPVSQQQQPTSSFM